MSNDKPTPSVASEWLSKISDLMGNTDKGLDQVRKSIQSDLGKLRQSPSLENLAANLLQVAEIGFRKDLDEIGLRGEAQTEYIALFRKTWQEKEMAKKADEIIKSPELAAMNEFITTIENLPKLHEVMVMAQPQPKWQAMLKDFASRIPGLDKYVDRYFGPVLNMLGLGYLAGPETPASGTQTASATQTPGTEKPAEDTAKAPAETKEPVDEMTPKSALCVGDSMTWLMRERCAKMGDKNPLKGIDGVVQSIAKGGADANWAIEILKNRLAKGEKPFKNIENAVVLFGSNDLAVDDAKDTPENDKKHTAEKIFGRIKEVWRLLKEGGVKYVYAVTVPPYHGVEAYDKRPNYRKRYLELNDMIRGAAKAGLVHYVMDTCKPESEGGLASNDTPTPDHVQKLSKNADTDHCHPKGEVLAEFYMRHLRRGTALAANQEGAKTDATESPEKSKAAPTENAFQTPLDGAEVVPEDFKPGATLMTGDSIYNAYPRGLRERLNVTDTVTKGAMQSSWGLRELEKKPKEFFKKFEYAVIGFGTNDLGSTASAEDIWGRSTDSIQKHKRIFGIIALLKQHNPKIKILMPTIPPGKGCLCGQWGADYKGVEARRRKVNELIWKAKEEGIIAGVIDLAATKSKGGLASDNDPEKMAAEYQRWKDGVHPEPKIMTAAIRRAQYLARNK